MTIRIHVTIRVLRVPLGLVEVRVSWLGHSEPLKKKKITSKSHKPNNNQDLNLQIHKPKNKFTNLTATKIGIYKFTSRKNFLVGRRVVVLPLSKVIDIHHKPTN